MSEPIHKEGDGFALDIGLDYTGFRWKFVVSNKATGEIVLDSAGYPTSGECMSELHAMYEALHSIFGKESK